MISCRYVGSDCASIGDTEYDAVGQKAELDEDLFVDAVLGNAYFITEGDFQLCGFTAEELRLYGPVGVRVNPTIQFLQKLDKAQQLCRGAKRQFEEIRSFAAVG